MVKSYVQNGRKHWDGSAGEIVFTDNTAYNSVVMAIGSKETAKFQKAVSALFPRISDGAGHLDRDDFLDILGELVASMKETK